jgi:C4-type Zn-finger protein
MCPHCNTDLTLCLSSHHYHDPSQCHGHGEITREVYFCEACGYAEAD